MPKLFSVIIPVYGDWERLALCLQSLERQSMHAASYEIIVANNEPHPRALPEGSPLNARIVHEPKPGSYAARNAAVAFSCGNFLAFTDSDCIPHPRWLEHGLAVLKAHAGTRVTGPVPIFRAAGASYSAYLYDRHTAFHQRWMVEQGRCVTANLLVARDVFEQIGPFDPGLVSGGDTEWGTRAARMGVPIVYDEAVVVDHPSRPSLRAIFNKRRRIAGSDAVRLRHPAYRYILSRLVPPVRVYRELRSRRPGPLQSRDRALLFLIHWAARIGEAQEFLLVRLGLKRPNRA